MSKAEQRALEVYPPKLATYSDLFGEETLDDNGLKRAVFIEGYRQAEKDLELTLKDMSFMRLAFEEAIEFGVKWKEEQFEKNSKEPVNEDLEKEIDRAHRIFYDEVGWDSDEGARAYVADWFAHYFANWQKNHMEANRLAHCNSISNEQAELEQKFLDEHLDKYNRMPTFLDAIEYGMRFQKEQMMKNAVECEYFDGSLFRNDLREKYRDCDKVKVIVIKED